MIAGSEGKLEHRFTRTWKTSRRLQFDGGEDPGAAAHRHAALDDFLCPGIQRDGVRSGLALADDLQRADKRHIAGTADCIAVEHGAETEKPLFRQKPFPALLPVAADAGAGIAAFRPVAQWASDRRAGRVARRPARIGGRLLRKPISSVYYTKPAPNLRRRRTTSERASE